MQDKVWLQALGKYGPIAVLAIGLSWFLATTVDAQLRLLNTTLSAHVRQTNTEQRELRWFLRAVCYNTARTQSERDACTPPPTSD